MRKASWPTEAGSRVSFRILLMLVFCNVVWSAHPAMGKLVLMGFPAIQAAWLRYLTAFVSYAAAVQAFRRVPAGRGRLKRAFMVPAGPRRGREWVLMCGLGFAAFCFSPILQMSGLEASRAMDNALIVAMEPLMVVLLAWLALGERLSAGSFLAFGIALAGFALLTGLTPAGLSREWAEGGRGHLLGNLAMLVSLSGEAAYSIGGRKLVERHAPVAVFGSVLGAGVVFLTVFTAWLSGLPSWASIVGMPWQSAVGLLWLGPLGTGFGYLVWMRALRDAPVRSLAITLFIQPILGPVWGTIFFGERLSATQAVGCVLILVAVFGQPWLERGFQSHEKQS